MCLGRVPVLSRFSQQHVQPGQRERGCHRRAGTFGHLWIHMIIRAVRRGAGSGGTLAPGTCRAQSGAAGAARPRVRRAAAWAWGLGAAAAGLCGGGGALGGGVGSGAVADGARVAGWSGDTGRWETGATGARRFRSGSDSDGAGAESAGAATAFRRLFGGAAAAAADGAAAAADGAATAADGAATAALINIL
eukprot:gene22022-biopygen19212